MVLGGVRFKRKSRESIATIAKFSRLRRAVLASVISLVYEYYRGLQGHKNCREAAKDIRGKNHHETAIFYPTQIVNK